MARRRRRVAPPPRAPEWDLHYLDLAAEEGWGELSNQAPGPTRDAYDQIRRDPKHVSGRQHPLRGDLAMKTIGGMVMRHWQYEVLGGARIWYAIDEANHTLILTHAGVGHPKETE
ncbi:MAG TPA: hypothetical protein VHO06_27255 [Polyangia bacterium]|nr:hypothetical protein [Polyangia bacterium]